MSHGKQSKTDARQALERRILRGLACEWDEALRLLMPGQVKQLKKPLFSLKSMKSRLGYWSAEKNEICLNRHFVLNHPWDSVREVLIHEMAHQFVDQVFYAPFEPPHGQAFHEACRMLRANPKASGNYKPLHERILSGSVDTDDKIMLRIKKLMALSESANRHEAESAMSKVHDLIAKYNIAILEKDPDRNFSSIFIGTPSLRHPREEYFIANLLQDYYFIQGIWVPAYVVDKCKMGRVLEISGTVQNIQIASYVYDFIKQYIHTKWTEYNQSNTLNRYRRSDFAVGVIEGFRSKLTNRQIGKRLSSHSASFPVIIEDPLLKKYLSNKYPYIRRFKKKISGPHIHVFNDGRKIGKKMIIHKGIHNRIKTNKLFLP